jgi:hypothetical protein
MLSYTVGGNPNIFGMHSANNYQNLEHTYSLKQIFQLQEFIL